MPQAAGPPGTPQRAQGLSSATPDAGAVDAPAPTANTDNCFSSDSPAHFGQAGATPDLVRNSN